jgi:flagellar biosynthesis chaperone FliJ
VAQFVEYLTEFKPNYQQKATKNKTEEKKKTQISKIRNKTGEITTNIKEIQGIIRDYFDNLYTNKFENLEEMEKFIDT